MSQRRVYSLAEIANRFGGEVVGDAEVQIEQVATLETAQANQITFLTHGKYRRQLASTLAGAVIVGRDMRGATNLPHIVCDNPYAYFARVSALLNASHRAPSGIHPTAVVEESAMVAKSASIGAHAYIGKNAQVGEGTVIGAGCFLGDNVTVGQAGLLHANVTVYHQCLIGARAVVHAGAVIGADGFGIAMEQERWLKIPQIGRVVIGDDVEIGANTTIDRGALDDTVIEDGVKLDNQVQVAHNVRIGAHTAIAGCVGIAGSARIGRHCRVGGGAIILGHLQIADHVDISAGTLIGKSIHEPGAYTAIYPFETHQAWRKNAVYVRRLERMAQDIRRLEKNIENLKPHQG